MNLAISDILYSVFYFIGNIDGIWTYKYSCYVVRKLIGNTLLYSEWMSIAMIAVVRCNGIMKSGKPSMFSSRRTRYLVFVLIRLLCVTFLLPLPSKVRLIAQNYLSTKKSYMFLFQCEDFSNRISEMLSISKINMRHISCTIIKGECGAIIMDTLVFSLAGLIIVSSYAHIWFTMQKSQIYLRQESTRYSEVHNLCYTLPKSVLNLFIL